MVVGLGIKMDWRRQFASGKSAVPEPQFAALVVEAPSRLPEKSERRRRTPAGMIEVAVAGIVIRAVRSAAG